MAHYFVPDPPTAIFHEEKGVGFTYNIVIKLVIGIYAAPIG